jgi:hypothetical protein
MPGFQLHTPRGSFYSPKGQRSRFFFVWKALVAFYLRAHRTVNSARLLSIPTTSIVELVVASFDSSAHQTVRWHTGQSGVATCPPEIVHRHVRPADGLGTRHCRCAPDSPVLLGWRMFGSTLSQLEEFPNT